MDLPTSLAIVAGMLLIGGYLAYTRLSEKIDELHDDVRGLTRDVARIDDEHGSGIRRGEAFSEAAYQGVTDLRIQHEDH